MRSGEDHCDQELADEVWRGPLRSRAGRRGPARRRTRKEQEGGRGRMRATDIKSNNPHLAGGELWVWVWYGSKRFTTQVPQNGFPKWDGLIYYQKSVNPGTQQNPPHLLVPWQPPGLSGQLPVAQHRHRERLSEATVELMCKKQHLSS